jgi:hypothetical protein
MTFGVALFSRMVVCIWLCDCTSALPAAEVADADFFQSQVAPLLTKKCLSCHSHEARRMEGGLTLDSKSGWQSGGDRGPAIVPSKPNESLLISAVRYNDADLQMPPEEKLADAELAILVEWVQRGAPDPRETKPADSLATDWWSLKTLTAPDVPDMPVARHPIDAFIQARLAEQGLHRATRADRVTLTRRLYVDLHGCLPTPEEVDAFIASTDPGAYEHLIDELLSSPRYGERWARHWLDVIHFADSHGCEHDVKRPNAWRFRDYVIDRLNDDVPWDRFIREQLAADEFFPNDPQLTAALGFIAAGPLELSRAGTAPVTFDYLDRDDMVTQTMAAFVSTTANCARCHMHKFDPITQDDYYALQAVFAGVGKGDVEYDTSAETRELRHELESLVSAAATLDAQILLQPKYAAIVAHWVASQQSQPVQWSILHPDAFVASSGATLTKQNDASILAEGELADQEIYTVTSPVDLDRLSAVQLEVLADPTLPEGGPGRAGNGNLHLSEVDIQWFPAGAVSSTKLKISRASADFDQEGWTSAQAIDGNPSTGWAIFPKVNESHQIVFELERPLDVVGGGKLAITLKQQHPPKHVIGRFRLSVTATEGASARILRSEVIEGLGKPAEQRTDAESIAIAAVALETYAKHRLAELPPKEVVYGVSSSWSHAKKLPTPQSPKVVHLLRRGDFEQPIREMGPGTLSAIATLPARFELIDPHRESARRAALADWLAHPDNPLTWRSIVNRVWHYHFGRGLSDTPNDFGRMGSQPTHPELLDWLAVWFRDEAKGSLKELHRLILTSETWQQTSLAAPNSIDQNNQLLWRMNRRRMEAEVFRDSVLRLSGRLDWTMGGPGIEQFKKTEGAQATPSLDYTAYDWESPGANRRSIYRVVWRGIADPFMEAMDFPDLGLLAPKRGFSVSALQSLAMYNNDFVLHASNWIAERVERESEDKTLAAQVARAVELAWLRSPTQDESLRFVDYADKHGMPAFCRVLLNSNEFLFVD